MYISDGVMTWGLREPARPAVVAGEGVTTYGELARRARVIANNLHRSLPAGQGLPVAIALDDPIRFLTAFLGIVEAGAIAVPLSSRWTAREAANACEGLHLQVCISDDALDYLPCPVVALETLLANPPGGAAFPPRNADSPFYIGFSSGSAGAPKAIVRDHRAWLQSFLGMSIEFGIGPGMHVAVPGALFFSFSLIAALHTLYVGATLHVPSQGGLPGTLELLAKEPRSVYMLPSVLEAAVEAAERRGHVFPEIARIICAGEKLPTDTRNNAAHCFPRADITEYYGASELGFVSVIGSQDAPAHPNSVGRPFLGAEVAVLGQDGAQLAPHEVGLLGARTAYGFQGYWGDPRGPDAIEYHGWHTVGDLAWYDEEGYVYLAGRWDNMLILRGENIYPEEIEQAIAALPGVHSAAVVGEPADAPRHLVAIVVGDSQGPRADTILSHCRGRFPVRKVPRRVIFVDALPWTATGKLARAELPALLATARG